MFQKLRNFLAFSGFQTEPANHDSSSLNEEQIKPLNMSAFPDLPSYDVTFLPKDDTLIFDLDGIPSIIRTPQINISPAERAKLTPNAKFDPLTVANLRLQLLLLHTFNGNFIRCSYSHSQSNYPGCGRRIEDITTYNNDHGFKITKLSSIQCEHLHEVAGRTEPPLHGSVVDLCCLFPYTGGIAEVEEYEILPDSSWKKNPFSPAKETSSTIPGSGC